MTLKPARRLSAQTLLALALALTLFPLTLAAHAQSADAKPAADEPPAPESRPVDRCLALRASPTETRTFYLANATQQKDANEILVALRNLLCPSPTRIYLAEYQNAVLVQAPSSQLALAETIVHDLDRPRKTYRLTYTVTEIDDNKPTGTQHYSMTVTGDKNTSMKEGTKIPVATGSYSDGGSSANGTQTQFTYLDIGMSFDASIAELANGVRLNYKVEQSSLDTPVTIEGVTEPVIRQSVLDSSTVLTLDKPVLLGSIDVPGSTRHLDIAVVAERLK